MIAREMTEISTIRPQEKRTMLYCAAPSAESLSSLDIPKSEITGSQEGQVRSRHLVGRY